ncbi:putative WRKY transcription factor 53 [Dichanthelium oligosanthes]|uniref:Putative WRKY transcription factor 53 n=1 Tax=Dichanthelium oligosanthes TaxID=888268 RepID=A0A1E5WLZ7_9POAL|nr:putative WRKY transcription factor 53 [Dichanthelium oligosanthes]
MMARSMESVDGNGASGGLVVTELSHIKELVRQLELHLGGSHDLCKHLTTQIFSLTERSISIITSSSGLDGARKRAAADTGLASPLSAATPTSDVTDGPFKNTKKRKVMEKRKHQVRVSSAGGGAGENPVDDGHSWRKYGQKEILGAKNPRGYYRCTHRHSQGCQATKQVQRTDEDPTLFDVIYHGEHTCVQRPMGAATAAAGQPEHNPDANSLLQSLTAGLTVKTEGLPALAADPQGGWSATAPFYFSSSTPMSGCLATTERSPFSAPSTSENWGVSPATSDSNHVASYLPFEDAEWRGQNELQEVVSALVAASAAPAPAVDNLDELLDMDDIASFFA